MKRNKKKKNLQTNKANHKKRCENKSFMKPNPSFHKGNQNIPYKLHALVFYCSQETADNIQYMLKEKI